MAGTGQAHGNRCGYVREVITPTLFTGTAWQARSLHACKPPWAEGSGGDTAASQLQDGTAQAVVRATPTAARIQGEGADLEDSHLNLILESNVVTSNKVEHVPILQQQNSTSRNSHGFSQGGQIYSQQHCLK